MPATFSIREHDPAAEYTDLATSGSALIQGDAHRILTALPDGIAQTVVTCLLYTSDAADE